MSGGGISAESIQQIGLLASETVAVALLLAALFRARRRFGLSPLFATLGVFQYLQVLLAFSLYVEVIPGAFVSPGSVVLFSGSLFGLFLVFLRESPQETKTLVYGLLAANLALSALSSMVSLHFESPLVRNPHHLPEDLFRLDAKIMVIGTLVLVLDMLLMIFLYPLVCRVLRSPFLRAAVTLCSVLVFDSLIFMTAAFGHDPFYMSALGASVVAKSVAGIIYSVFLAAYVRWVEPSSGPASFATAGDVIRWGLGKGSTTRSTKPMPRDPDLGILPAGHFPEMLNRFLALGESLESQVTVCVFRLAGPIPDSERRDVLRYLLAVLRGQLSQKAAFGRYVHDGIAVVLPSTGRPEAVKACRGVRRALEDSLARVRPTRRIETFGIQIGLACSPADGLEPEALLAHANNARSSGE